MAGMNMAMVRIRILYRFQDYLLEIMYLWHGYRMRQ